MGIGGAIGEKEKRRDRGGLCLMKRGDRGVEEDGGCRWGGEVRREIGG